MNRTIHLALSTLLPGLIAAFLVACQTSAPTAQAPDSEAASNSGALPQSRATRLEREAYQERYHLLSDPLARLTDQNHPRLWARIPFSKITVTKSQSGGVGGSDTWLQTSLIRGGQARKDTERNRAPQGSFVEDGGEFDGTIDLYEYSQLCAAIERLHILELENDYLLRSIEGHTVYVSHSPSRIVTIAHEDGEKRIWEDYGSGPPELHAFIALFEKFSNQIKWNSNSALVDPTANFYGEGSARSTD